jgi:hypothetical protein
VVRAFPDAIRDETNFTIASAFGMSSVATISHHDAMKRYALHRTVKNKEAANLKRPFVVCHLEKYSAIRTMAIAANQSISSQR